MEIAEEFFDNEKHFSEFLLAVSYYYRKKNYVIKNKIVQKYFKTYQKTMDFILEFKYYGEKSALLRSENQKVKVDTLPTPLPNPLPTPLPTNNKELIINNKEVIIKDKEKEKFSPPTILEVIDYFKEKGYTEISAKKAFDYYDIANWKDSKGNQVKNWKQKMISVWMKPENKINELTNQPKRKKL